MENNENQTRKSKTKNSTKPKTEKEEALKKNVLFGNGSLLFFWL